MTPSADILLATKIEIEQSGVATDPQAALALSWIVIVELKRGMIFLFLREPQWFGIVTGNDTKPL